MMHRARTNQEDRNSAKYIRCCIIHFTSLHPPPPPDPNSAPFPPFWMLLHACKQAALQRIAHLRGQAKRTTPRLDSNLFSRASQRYGFRIYRGMVLPSLSLSALMHHAGGAELLKSNAALQSYAAENLHGSWDDKADATRIITEPTKCIC